MASNSNTTSNKPNDRAEGDVIINIIRAVMGMLVPLPGATP